MAMLKTTKSYAKNAGVRRQRYAEKKERALMRAVGPFVSDPDRWGAQFDRTRDAWGKNDGRTVYDFIISPNPKDHVRPDALMSLAQEWVRERYQGYEWAIVIHDDNKKRIPHAHVYVNAVSITSGNKLHIDSEQTATDARLLQELCKARGWSAFENGTVHSEVKHEELRDRRRAKERYMELRGVNTWKGRMRKAIDAAIEESGTWLEFLRAVGRMGYDPSVSHRGITFYPIDDKEAYPCKGRNLDDGEGRYTIAGIQERLDPDLGFAMKVLDREGRPVPLLHHEVKPWREWLSMTLPDNALEREAVRLGLCGRTGLAEATEALSWMAGEGLSSFKDIEDYAEEKARGIEEGESELAALEDLSRLLKEAGELAGERDDIDRDRARGRTLAADAQRRDEICSWLQAHGLDPEVGRHRVWSDVRVTEEKVAVTRGRVGDLKDSLSRARSAKQSLKSVRSRLPDRPTHDIAADEKAYAVMVRMRLRRRSHVPRVRVVSWEEMVNMRYESPLLSAVASSLGEEAREELERRFKREREVLLSWQTVDSKHSVRGTYERRVERVHIPDARSRRVTMSRTSERVDRSTTSVPRSEMNGHR